MKKLAFTIFAVVVLALPVCAQSIVAVADIPFGFVAGNATMPAGQYVVDVSAATSVVALVGPDLRTRFLASIPDDERAGSSVAELVFHRYGDRNFLSEIRTTGRGREFPASRMESEAMNMAGAARTRQVIVVAMR
jgi:hypothetical protein